MAKEIGKDIKFGHDKRPISTFTNTEQELYNYQTGELLLDESGLPLVTESEEFFLSDATMERATSVAFNDKARPSVSYTKHTLVGVSTAIIGVDLNCTIYPRTINSLAGSFSVKLSGVRSCRYVATNSSGAINSGFVQRTFQNNRASDSGPTFQQTAIPSEGFANGSSLTYEFSESGKTTKTFRFVYNKSGTHNSDPGGGKVAIYQGTVNTHPRQSSTVHQWNNTDADNVNFKTGAYDYYSWNNTTTVRLSGVPDDVVVSRFIGIGTHANTLYVDPLDTTADNVAIVDSIAPPVRIYPLSLDGDGKIQTFMTDFGDNTSVGITTAILYHPKRSTGAAGLALYNSSTGAGTGHQVRIDSVHAGPNTGSKITITDTNTGGLSISNPTSWYNPKIDYINVVLLNPVTDNGLAHPKLNRLYFNGIGSLNVKIEDKLYGNGIPDGTFVTHIYGDIISASNSFEPGMRNTQVVIRRSEEATAKITNTWKIEEKFAETSEVSTTLLGVNRAETQLSLFSNVSSYGLDKTEFESYSFVGGRSFNSWNTRANKTYGNHYDTKIGENTMESAITLESYPVPYSFPFGPEFARLGWHTLGDPRWEQYTDFVRLGNALYNYFSSGSGSSLGYSNEWIDNFLNPSDVQVVAGSVKYFTGFTRAFALIDNWTETWRSLVDKDFKDPNGNILDINNLVNFTATQTLSSSRPGYSTQYSRFMALQSRRVFRYQPGRISGFTFGVKVSDEPKSGYKIEWGISNETDQYMFKIYKGQISIMRRSTIMLEDSVISKNGLDPTKTSVDIDGTFYNTIQPLISQSDPYAGADAPQLYNLEIPRGNWNGDRLDGNGISGYQIQTDRVTMWKIEFGWYGAIGARFYAYVPVNAGDARWVVIHTMVLENQLKKPCLQDSYFRLRYIIDVFDSVDMRDPCYIYKYGASYYIDGGDEGTSTMYSVNSGITSTYNSGQKPLIGITPKTFMINSVGESIKNKKLIIPEKINIASDAAIQAQIITCSGCPGFGHVYTPGIASTVTGREIQASINSNILTSVDNTYFFKQDEGAKLVAPGIYNWYIKSVDVAAGAGAPPDSYTQATLEGFGPGDIAYPSKDNTARQFGGSLISYSGITTTIRSGSDPTDQGNWYGYPIRLSNYEAEFASDFKLSGSKIEVQYLNPRPIEYTGQYSDFTIGITDKQPNVSLGGVLNDWTNVTWRGVDDTGSEVVGTGNTNSLPLKDLHYGEYSHDHAGMNEFAEETGEVFRSSTFTRARCGMDGRIPNVGESNPTDGGGVCSKITFTVRPPTTVSGFTESIGNPDPSISGAGFFLVGTPGGGQFSTLGVDNFNDGQVAIKKLDGTIVTPGSRYEGEKKSFVQNNLTVEYIQITESLGAPYDTDSNLSIAVRPILMEAARMPTRSKIYNYEPWPLYLAGKLRDNSMINGITVKETVGDFVRTITPKLYVKAVGYDKWDPRPDGFVGDRTFGFVSDTISVTNAGGKAATLGEAPSHFREINRLSSALYDSQTEQTLRPGVTRDTFYVGKDESMTVDMKKIFDVDRDSITPDNQNVEATFFVTKKIPSSDGLTAGRVRASVNFKEQ